VAAIIHVENVSKEYIVRQHAPGLRAALKPLVHPDKKRVQAVQNLSFDVQPGDFVGFIGENGAGKSTTVKMMTGILYPTSGKILTNGVVPYERRRENAKNIGVIFGQRSRLMWELPMEDTFALNKEIYKIPAQVYARNVKLFVDMLDMGSYVRTPVRQLSLGQRMRAEIALAMLHDPPVLFLDEPTIGLDVMAKKYLRDFFKARNTRDGTTVILTSHDTKDIESVAMRIIMLARGELIFDGAIGDLFNWADERSLAVFTFSEKISAEAASGLGSPSGDGYFLTVAFDPEKRKLPELIAAAGELGEIANVEVKPPDVEDVIRKVYQYR
jgi:ABC-2 type transport system ATP-binding protein